MRSSFPLLALLLAVPVSGAEKPKPFATGLKNPESVLVGPDGRIYVSQIGEKGKDGDGSVDAVVDGKIIPFATGLDDPRGLATFQKWIYVADNKRILRIDPAGKVSVFAAATAFPKEPIFLNDLAVDARGTLYVSDTGDRQGHGGAVYRISARGKVDLLADPGTLPGMHSPNGVLMDGESFLLLADMGTGIIHRINLETKESEKFAEGLGRLDGIVRDRYGRLFASDNSAGKIYAIPRPGAKPVLFAEGFEFAADIGFDAANKTILVPDMKAGTLTALPAVIPGFEVDETTVAFKTAAAFPDIRWAGWESDPDSGPVVAFRPVVMTYANDGSNRVFVGTEQGVIHAFKNSQDAKESSIFADLQDRVKYDDRTNEEGLLGLAFHPKFKENGEVFLFYTPKAKKLTNHLSRFRTFKNDPNRLDPASEEILMTFEKPFWNHNGGTIAFGPDGFLYITHGDGDLGNDPFENGQNLGSLLGKIHRIDVDHKENGKNYAIPKDNPFVGRAGARPEIWAYGLRNVWRMSFDRKTGQLWAADVGQNLFEEIDIIVKGGNYGWNVREGLHPFGTKGVGPRADIVEPVWEYDHDVGKSITGGHVYRGKRFPELEGHYIYGDYVTGRIWALKYDEAQKRVVANRPFSEQPQPIYSWGEDEAGELYFLTSTKTGKGIFGIERK